VTVTVTSGEVVPWLKPTCFVLLLVDLPVTVMATFDEVGRDSGEE